MEAFATQNARTGMRVDLAQQMAALSRATRTQATTDQVVQFCKAVMEDAKIQMSIMAEQGLLSDPSNPLSDWTKAIKGNDRFTHDSGGFWQSTVVEEIKGQDRVGAGLKPGGRSPQGREYSYVYYLIGVMDADAHIIINDPAKKRRQMHWLMAKTDYSITPDASKSKGKDAIGIKPRSFFPPVVRERMQSLINDRVNGYMGHRLRVTEGVLSTDSSGSSLEFQLRGVQAGKR